MQCLDVEAKYTFVTYQLDSIHIVDVLTDASTALLHENSIFEKFFPEKLLLA